MSPYRPAGHPFRAHPFEAIVASVLAIVGIAFLIFGPDPDSLRALLPAWLAYAWAVGLTLGGGSTAVGLLARLPYVERAGLGVLAATSAVYAAVVLTWYGLDAALTAVTYLSITGASMIRIRALGQALRHVDRGE